MPPSANHGGASGDTDLNYFFFSLAPHFQNRCVGPVSDVLRFFSFKPKDVLNMDFYQMQRFSRVILHQSFKMKTTFFSFNPSQSLDMFLACSDFFLSLKPHILIYFVLIKKCVEDFQKFFAIKNRN